MIKIKYNTKAQSRLEKNKLKKKLKRLKAEGIVLSTLLVLYAGYQLITANGISPVRATVAPTFDVKEVEVAVEVVKEVEVDRTFTTEKQQILAYIVEVFGDDADDAITVINKCENSTFEQSRTNHNRNGSVDYGIFQVNSIHEKRYGSEFKTDWKANIDVAYKIFEAAGKKWTPWTCAHVVGQANYLGQ